MRDDTHGYASPYAARRPVKPFEVIERVRDADGIGKRTDTCTSSLRYALERRDALRANRRPAYVIDVSGQRVETRWL